jgi:predicted SAM-dependent methyltransferase
MKLHLGGLEVKQGWSIVNIQNKPGVDFIGDISDLSNFDGDSVSEIYASHVLEHVKKIKILDTLKGVRRVLKTGGKFYISVPDLDILCHTFIGPFATTQVKNHILGMMFGGQIDENDFHFFGYNQEILFDLLKQAQFTSASRVETFGIFNDTSNYKPFGFPISLNVIAIK